MDNWEDYLEDNTLRILAKPNAAKTQIIGWDDSRKALKVAVKGKPEAGVANLNLLKFFSNISGKNVYIISGKTSRKKVIGFE